MNIRSKQTIGIIVLAAAIVSSLVWYKTKKKKPKDDYDWLMW